MTTLGNIVIERRVPCPTLDQVTRYLTRHGWEELARGDRVVTYEACELFEFELDVPASESFGDYARRIGELIESICAYAPSGVYSADIYDEIMRGEVET